MRCKKAIGSFIVAFIMLVNTITVFGAESRKVLNGSFETPVLESGRENQRFTTDQPNVFWQTTNTNKSIEYFNNQLTKNPHMPLGGRGIPQGNQAVELNEEQESTLYQIVNTVPESKYEWGLSHRSRGGVGSNNQADKDTMALFIGKNQDFAPLKNQKNDNRDQFMQMADWYKKSKGSNYNYQLGSEKITLYTAPFAKDGDFKVSTDPIGFTQTNERTEKWEVWIITSGRMEWMNYGLNKRALNDEEKTYLKNTSDSTPFSYDVPKNQEKTLFAFSAIASAGGITYGNMLDDIKFQLSYNLSAKINQGGQINLILAEEENVIEKATVDNSSPVENKTVLEGVDVTINVAPNQGYQFTGAYIDGKWVKSSEFVYNGQKGTYQFKMDENHTLDLRCYPDHNARPVTFILGEDGTPVPANPEQTTVGGTVSVKNEKSENSIKENGEYIVSGVSRDGDKGEKSCTTEKNDQITVTSSPSDGYRFLGWYDGEEQKSTQLSYQYTADGSTTKTLTARFAPIYYSVEHYYEELNGTYSKTPEVRERKVSTDQSPVFKANDQTGKLDELKKDRQGFAIDQSDKYSYHQTTIQEDSSTVVKIYYKRKRFKITYKINGTIDPNEEYKVIENIPYGSDLSLIEDNMDKTGYAWSGWSELPAKMPEGDLVVVGHYSPKSNTLYKVEHYYEKTDGTYPNTPDNIQNYTGITGEKTKAEANDMAGFQLKDPIVQEEIKPDGSTVIKVYYQRNTYKITYQIINSDFTETAGGENFNNNEYKIQENIKFGTPITLITDDMQKQGYEFSRWSGIPENMPEKDLVVTGSYTPETNNKYKVNHILMKRDGESYTIDNTIAVQEYAGTTNEMTKVQENTYHSYQLKEEIIQQPILADGSTEVNVYYIPMRYSVVYEITGDYFTEATYKKIEYDYGTPISHIQDDMNKAGYVWSQWSYLPSTMPAENLVVKGKYTSNPTTQYTVNHFKEMLDGTYPAKPDDTETLGGVTGEDTQAVEKNYEGFSVNMADQYKYAQVKIKEDGSTVVNIYYKRNLYDIQYKITGNYFAKEAYKIISGIKYGTPIELIADNMKKQGYEFSGWSELPKTMPNRNIIIEGSYTPSRKTTYQVEHYLEKLDGSYPAKPADRTEKTGTTGGTTVAEERSYKGFKVQPFKQKVIKEDGSTVVKIYYRRVTYDIVYRIDGEHFNTPEYKVIKNVKYGTPLSYIKDDMAKTGYQWNGWSGLPSDGKMPASDMILTGSYNKNPDSTNASTPASSTTATSNSVNQKAVGTTSILPNTGDSNNIVLWMILLSVSTGMFLGVLLLNKNKKSN